MSSKLQVAAYYFPGYHADPRNDARFHPGWTEWQLLRAARPRFPGHRQPRQPLWGEEDEAHPAIMARKIGAAADHGVNVFLFDWYWYDGPYLQGALDHGFLRAPNRERLKFALMWANHNWVELFPRQYNAPEQIIYPGAVNPGQFRLLAEHVVENYFKQPNYWRLDGCPYFSLYDLPRFIEGAGSDLGKAAEMLRQLRQATRAAGFPDLHLNLVFWQQNALPGTSAMKITPAMVRELGFDSVTSYVWVHHVSLDSYPTTPYETVFQQIRDYTDWAAESFGRAGLPYFPNVSVGWDATPRTDQSGPWQKWEYPFTPCVTECSRKQLEQACQWARDHVIRSPETKGIITVNSWNEWTEGSYLEPDTQHGFDRLEGLRNVFVAPTRGSAALNPSSPRSESFPP